MSSDQDRSVSHRKLWLRVLLGASLALNLLVVGLAIGAALRSGGPDGTRRPPAALGATLYRELSQEDRRAFRKAMREVPQDHRADRKAMAQLFSAALRAEPFDAAGFEALLLEHAGRRAEWQAVANKALIVQLDQMSDRERFAYADRLESAMSRTRRHGKERREKRD